MTSSPLSRREFLSIPAAAAAASIIRGDEPPKATGNVHQQLLEEATRLEKQRRDRFAAVKSPRDLERLQEELRGKFLGLLDGLPEAGGVPPVKKTGRIEAEDYVVEKLVFQSFPDYYVPALLYLPTKRDGAVAGILSPCGHSAVGKAAAPYQTLHINLAKRGYAVLTYDPVGQGERSQFWDAERGKSRFNLTCGEHAVLGNPLYLLGTSLARYRIWDGIRGIDYLASLPEVDPERIGCVGNSGGGTLTAYLAALDRRVRVAVISCYITTLPRRMGNRIEKDPDADPEQDIFGFVSEGIDHAGLLALRAPRPTLLGTAREDFFPIEGARESFAEAQRLFELAGAGDRIRRAEADGRHGLSLPLRQAAYTWFDQHLARRNEPPREKEIAVEPRPAKELLVCAEGQVSLTFRSRPLLPLAVAEFRKRKQSPRVPLKELLRLDPKLADVRLTDVAVGGKDATVHFLCVNGIDAPDWREEATFLRALARQGAGVTVIDPRGVGRSRPALEVRGHAYGDPLCGVEENIAYNAFLIGKSLLGMRVTDVLEAVAQIRAKESSARLVVCGRRDAALVACLAAAVEPAITRVAVEEMLLSFWPLFDEAGRPINAASVLPYLLRDFGDMDAVLAAIAPRAVLAAAPRGEMGRRAPNVTVADKQFTGDAEILLKWLGS
jgi:dienelactone hydrolase